MDDKRVKDLMLPLDEYAVVPEDATLVDALVALEEAQGDLPPGRHPHRAVLVVDKGGTIVGKLGHLAFLKAMEPKYALLGDIQTLSRAGLSSEFITDMMSNMRFWGDESPGMRRRAHAVRVKDAMRKVDENIDENASLMEAIHCLVMWQTLSTLVTRNGQVVGILRLTDLFAAVSEYVRGSVRQADSGGE